GLIEPHLELFEGIIARLCKLKECQVNYDTPREERAKNLSNILIKFGAAWIPSMIVKIALRRGINEVTGFGDGSAWWNVAKANQHDWSIMAADEGIHYGSMFVLNATTTGAGLSDDMIDASRNVLIRLGVPRKNASEIATMGVIHEFPNML